MDKARGKQFSLIKFNSGDSEPTLAILRDPKLFGFSLTTNKFTREIYFHIVKNLHFPNMRGELAGGSNAWSAVEDKSGDVTTHGSQQPLIIQN